jgi:hypothetical protein
MCFAQVPSSPQLKQEFEQSLEQWDPADCVASLLGYVVQVI